MRQGDRRRRHEEIDVSAEHGGDGRAAAIGRQMPHLQIARRFGKQHGRDVRRAVEARRTVDQLVGVGFGIGDQILQRFVGQIVVDDHHDRIGDDAGERNEIGIGEFRLAAEQFVDRGEAGNRHDVGQQRIAVRLGGCDVLRADRARRARLVLEHDRLLEDRLKRRVERPRDGVADAARRKRADHRDGARRIGVLRGCLTGRQRGGGGSRTDDETAAIHLAPLCFLLPVSSGLSINRSWLSPARGRSVSPLHRSAWRHPPRTW